MNLVKLRQHTHCLLLIGAVYSDLPHSFSSHPLGFPCFWHCTLGFSLSVSPASPLYYDCRGVGPEVPVGPRGFTGGACIRTACVVGFTFNCRFQPRVSIDMILLRPVDRAGSHVRATRRTLSSSLVACGVPPLLPHRLQNVILLPIQTA